MNPKKKKCKKAKWLSEEALQMAEKTREVSTHGHHQMVNTKIRSIIFLQPKMEKLYTVSKNKTRS